MSNLVLIDDGGAAATLAPRASFWQSRKCLALTLVLALLLGSPSLTYPFGRDQGEYAVLAIEELAGRVIYRDVFNVKPPMTHWLHALAMLSFGRSMLAIRLWNLAWQAATALVIMQIAKRVTGNGFAGVLAALVYALWYYSFDFWNTAQADGFQTLPAALALLAFQVGQERGRPWAYLASGAAVGAAVLFKYPIGALLPLSMLVTMATRRSGWMRPTLALGVGFGLAMGLGAASLAAQGALVPFVTSQVNYITQYTGRPLGYFGYLDMVRLILLHPLWPTIVLWLLALGALCALWFAWRRASLPAFMPLACWCLAATASYLGQAKGYGYHGLPMVGPLAVMIAYVASLAMDRAKTSKVVHLALVAAASFLVLLSAGGYALRTHHSGGHVALTELATGSRTLWEVYTDPRTTLSSGDEPGFSFSAQSRVAHHIAARSTPEDRVFIWGFEPTIYFLAERRPASRFIFNLPLYGDWSWPELRKQLLEDLTQSRPLYFVVVSDDALPLVTGVNYDSATALSRFAALRAFVEQDYELETVIDNMAVYRRR